ncbi:hypothetical protein HDU99_001865, partial [Rhizoclosmatium hyalinum]
MNDSVEESVSGASTTQAPDVYQAETYETHHGSAFDVDADLLQESEEIDAVFNNLGESGRPSKKMKPQTKKKFTSNYPSEYDALDARTKASTGSFEQMVFMNSVHKKISAKDSPAKKIQYHYHEESRKPGYIAPTIAALFIKPVFYWDVFEQYKTMCGNGFTRCSSCGRNDQWKANGYSTNYSRIFGKDTRLFGYCALYKCVQCKYSTAAWDPAFLIILPEFVQNEFPFVVTPKWKVTKELLNFVLSNHHHTGISQLYRMIRGDYFFHCLQKVHRYSLQLEITHDSAIKSGNKQRWDKLKRECIWDENGETSSLADLFINPYRCDFAWPTISYLDVLVKDHFDTTISKIADRVQANVKAEYLSFDAAKKITGYVKAAGETVASMVELASNEWNEIPHLMFRLSEDSTEFERSVQGLLNRLEKAGCTIKAIFIDNCCTWKNVFKAVFARLSTETELPVFLDRLHFLMRYTAATKRDHPLWEAFQRDLSDAITYLQPVSRDCAYPEGQRSKLNKVRIPWEILEILRRIQVTID